MTDQTGIWSLTFNPQKKAQAQKKLRLPPDVVPQNVETSHASQINKKLEVYENLTLNHLQTRINMRKFVDNPTKLVQVKIYISILFKHRINSIQTSYQFYSNIVSISLCIHSVLKQLLNKMNNIF